jgi:FKBP-type peptidyl-prolyl cis-trans isomerase SlyD
MAINRIEDDVVVTLHYRLFLEDGTLVEESTPDDPLVYLHGHDNIIPGLERELTGLAVGDRKTIVVEPDDAYGRFDPEAFDTLDRAELPAEIKPEVDMLLTFEDENGHLFDARIAEIDDKTITFDLNHPLAGKQLRFEVTVVELRQATDEELDHGHAHEGNGHHH